LIKYNVFIYIGGLDLDGLLCQIQTLVFQPKNHLQTFVHFVYILTDIKKLGMGNQGTRPKYQQNLPFKWVQKITHFLKYTKI